jgi:hypothetical protein
MRFFILIRTWVINLLLAGAVVFFGYQTLEVWFPNDKLEVNQPARKALAAGAHRRVAYRRNPPYKTYEVITQRNLFASDRREELPDATPAPTPAKPAPQLDSRFALFGIVISDSEKKALVSNLDKKTAVEKDYIWLKIGDKIGQLSISEIYPEHIIVTQGGYPYIIRLSDPSYQQKSYNLQKGKRRPGTKTIEIKRPKADSSAATK